MDHMCVEPQIIKAITGTKIKKRDLENKVDIEL